LNQKDFTASKNISASTLRTILKKRSEFVSIKEPALQNTICEILRAGNYKIGSSRPGVLTCQVVRFSKKESGKFFPVIALSRL
jgi:hypothetical protein